jgi:3-keto-5-aminohexanoate cleavage enzyme
MNPVIIECAINGATSKATNAHVPSEPPEIAAYALACMEAGAAIIHNHIDRYGVSVEQAVERYLEA